SAVVSSGEVLGSYISASSNDHLFPYGSGNIGLLNAGLTDFGRLCWGPCDASHPAIKKSSTTLLQARLGDDSAFVDMSARHILAAGTAPTIASGFGTSPSIVGFDDSITITIGTGGTATTG